MLKIVADTNILISSLIFGGKPDEVIKLARFGEVELYLSDFILQETARVLELKFQWKKERCKEAIELFQTFSQMVTPNHGITVIKNAKNDNHILECAKEIGANFLITGDTKHLLPLKHYETIQIVSPSLFLKLWKSGKI